MTPAQIFAATRLILLDFVGPTAHLFAGSPAHGVADRLAAAGVPLPDDADQYGPPELGAELIRQHRDQADTIETLVTAAEVEAARTAEPTPGCRDMLEAAQRTGRPVVIVSNTTPPSAAPSPNSACPRASTRSAPPRPAYGPSWIASSQA